ncbi:hypothetical protein E2C01_038649 [Portunus trituberculatus]|uniref:Uncharacterized protein n=1 Tax=Portunus trituberculatus TaxID=210409 RepID=A0A5B7FHI7_PORTR|nr:hypothetical protein [Portunus trituberculatus]
MLITNAPRRLPGTRGGDTWRDAGRRDRTPGGEGRGEWGVGTVGRAGTAPHCEPSDTSCKSLAGRRQFGAQRVYEIGNVKQ